MAKLLDYGLGVNEFKLQSCYCIRVLFLGGGTNTLVKGMNSLISPAVGYIVSLLIIYKDGFGIK